MARSGRGGRRSCGFRRGHPDVMAHEHDRRDIRDGLHLGRLRRAPQRRHGGARHPRPHLRRRLGDVPLHVYPDETLFTGVFGPARPGSEVSMWDEIKSASRRCTASGGTIRTITPSRAGPPAAVRPAAMTWSRSPLPYGRWAASTGKILNPGVIVDPEPTP